MFITHRTKNQPFHRGSLQLPSLLTAFSEVVEKKFCTHTFSGNLDKITMKIPIYLVHLGNASP